MAAPLYAFTSVDGQEWALVAASIEGEDRPALQSRANDLLFDIANVAPPAVWNSLVRHLQVAPHATAMKQPYWEYRDTGFTLGWLQAQYDKVTKLNS